MSIFVFRWFGKLVRKHMASVISFSFPEIGVENHLLATPKCNQSAKCWNTFSGTCVYSHLRTALEICFGSVHTRMLFILVQKLHAKDWVACKLYSTSDDLGYGIIHEE
jgi:hypothetical protein